MSDGLDFGVLILGLGALALLAGLGAWIREILNKPDDVSPTDTRLDPPKPARAYATMNGSTQPEVSTTQLISTFITDSAEVPLLPPQEEPTDQAEEQVDDEFVAIAQSVGTNETLTEPSQQQVESHEPLAPEARHAEAEQEALSHSFEEVPVVSTNIQTVLYHPDYRLLQLRFHNGSVYWYFEVPPDIHKALMAAESKGRFGHAHIYSVFSQKSISNQETQTFWGASQELQMEIIGSLIYAHDLARKDWTALKTITPNTCPAVVNEDLDAPDVPDEEQESEEEKPSLEELRQISIDAISDPVTDKALVLKDFFGWNDDFFSQADVNFISSCLDYDPSEDFDHPSDRLAQCRDLINGYPPSPIKLEVLIWMTRFADQHERFTDANNLLHQITAILKVFLANQDLEMKERFDFGMAAQELLMDDISETQSDPTFETDTLLSMLITLGRSDSDLVSVQKRAKRLLKYCKRISQERFITPSQDPGINKNMKHLKELIEKLNSFQRTVLFSHKDNDDDKI
jgi:hypothetical protein